MLSAVGRDARPFLAAVAEFFLLEDLGEDFVWPVDLPALELVEWLECFAAAEDLLFPCLTWDAGGSEASCDVFRPAADAAPVISKTTRRTAI